MINKDELTTKLNGDLGSLKHRRISSLKGGSDFRLPNYEPHNSDALSKDVNKGAVSLQMIREIENSQATL